MPAQDRFGRIARLAAEPELAFGNVEIVLEHDAQIRPLLAERTGELRGARGETELRRRRSAIPGDAARRVDQVQTRRGRIGCRMQLAVDSDDERRPSRIEHGVLASEEDLAASFDPHAHDSTRAGPAGAQTRTSVTPATLRSRASTVAASASEEMATTCGPASMVAQTSPPEARSSCNASRHPTVAGC